MADTIALYRRILSLLTPPELYRGSNCVLCDEYSTLQGSIDNVMATFIKVSEVRDAVNQLNQGKLSNNCSASLLDAMDTTLDLQKTLTMRLENLAAGMTVMDVSPLKEEGNENDGSSGNGIQATRKRKGKDKTDVNGTTIIKKEASLPSEEDGEKPHKKKQRHAKSHEDEAVEGGAKKEKSADAKKPSNDFSLAHDALTTILELKMVNKRMHLQSKGNWALALFDAKRVLKHQSIQDADTIDKAAANEAARALEAAAEVFTKLEWTAEYAKEARSALAAITDACMENETLTDVIHRARAQLQSVVMTIPAFLQHDSSDTMSTSVVNSPELQLLTHCKLVDSVHAQPPEEKAKLITKALAAIQQVMTGDDSCVRQVDVRQSITSVFRWIKDVPIQGDLAKEYARFANSITAYSTKLSGMKKRAEWCRLATNIHALLDEKTILSGSTVDVQALKEVSKMEEMHGRLLSVMNQVQQWRDGNFSTNQFDKVFSTINGVVTFKAKAWNPCLERLMCKCLKEVTSCVGMIKSKQSRDKRLKTLEKWKIALNKYS
uniref:Uncharacterized protein n=1 Tax=Peronospora matthiolae TaxID=2874970 RepID=A0AAV1UB33_9STRA